MPEMREALEILALERLQASPVEFRRVSLSYRGLEPGFSISKSAWNLVSPTTRFSPGNLISMQICFTGKYLKETHGP